MSTTSKFLKIGACLCILIGALFSVVTTQLLVERAFDTGRDALILIIYTSLAFVPFIVFVYPGFKKLRKSVFWSAVVVEFLVLGLFVWNLFIADLR